MIFSAGIPGIVGVGRTSIIHPLFYVIIVIIDVVFIPARDPYQGWLTRISLCSGTPIFFEFVL